jgi:hypothetical protein
MDIIKTYLNKTDSVDLDYIYLALCKVRCWNRVKERERSSGFHKRREISGLTENLAVVNLTEDTGPLASCRIVDEIFNII